MSTRGMTLIGVIVAVAMACGGQPPRSDNGSWREQDDNGALPECHPECVSGHWRDRPARQVLIEVTRCAKRPVYTPANLRGRVTLRVDSTTCTTAIAAVASALGLRMQRVETADGSLPEGAYVLTRPGDEDAPLVDVTTHEPTPRSGSGSETGLVGGGWSRETDSDDEPSSTPHDSHRDRDEDQRETRSCGGYGEPSCEYLRDPADDFKQKKRHDCLSRCQTTWNSCTSRCNYGPDDVTRSCRQSCRSRYDSCSQTCDSM